MTLDVWIAKYALSAPDEETARLYITRKALQDAPTATVEFVKGPTRDKGPRGYWRATVKRDRSAR
jgi:hypothetical protein